MCVCERAFVGVVSAAVNVDVDREMHTMVAYYKAR